MGFYLLVKKWYPGCSECLIENLFWLLCLNTKQIENFTDTSCPTLLCHVKAIENVQERKHYLEYFIFRVIKFS